jgi:hypothetical protein
VSKPKPFHFSKLRRKADVEKVRRQKKKVWMQKMYTLNTDADPKTATSPSSGSPNGPRSPYNAPSSSFVDEVMATLKKAETSALDADACTSTSAFCGASHIALPRSQHVQAKCSRSG